MKIGNHAGTKDWLPGEVQGNRLKQVIPWGRGTLGLELWDMIYGAVAQRTESAVSTRLVGGLNPSSPAIWRLNCYVEQNKTSS